MIPPAPLFTPERLNSDIQEIENIASLVCELAVPLDGIICGAFERLLELAGTRDFLPVFANFQHYLRHIQWARSGGYGVNSCIPSVTSYSVIIEPKSGGDSGNGSLNSDACAEDSPARLIQKKGIPNQSWMVDSLDIIHMGLFKQRIAPHLTPFPLPSSWASLFHISSEEPVVSSPENARDPSITKPSESLQNSVHSPLCLPLSPEGKGRSISGGALSPPLPSINIDSTVSSFPSSNFEHSLFSGVSEVPTPNPASIVVVKKRPGRPKKSTKLAQLPSAVAIGLDHHRLHTTLKKSESLSGLGLSDSQPLRREVRGFNPRAQKSLDSMLKKKKTQPKLSKSELDLMHQELLRHANVSYQSMEIAPAAE